MSRRLADGSDVDAQDAPTIDQVAEITKCRRRITKELEKIDWTGIAWRKLN